MQKAMSDRYPIEKRIDHTLERQIEKLLTELSSYNFLHVSYIEECKALMHRKNRESGLHSSTYHLPLSHDG